VDIIARMNANNAPRTTAPYLLLLALQISGAVAFIWQTLPEFRHIAINPGEPIPRDDLSEVIMISVLLLMQIPFWCRVRLVPIPFRYPSALLQHVFHFLGRLSFIFGSALFGILVFRHLPELERSTGFALMAARGLILFGCLFALFCTSLELERLGQAFEPHRN
jgi:hypothetical protein